MKTLTVNSIPTMVKVANHEGIYRSPELVGHYLIPIICFRLSDDGQSNMRIANDLIEQFEHEGVGVVGKDFYLMNSGNHLGKALSEAYRNGFGYRVWEKDKEIVWEHHHPKLQSK